MMAAIASGDTAHALKLLMAVYGAAVFAFCCRVMRDKTQAADVLQEVFEQAYRDLATWQQRSSLRSWLFGIANHRCLDAIKARGRRERRFVSHDGEHDVASPEVDPTQRLDGVTRAQALEQCLEGLSPQSRTTVLLRYQENLSYEEIGRVCDEKADTVRARVVRALPALRGCLEGKGIEP